MVKSMTGYGRGESSDGGFGLIVELRALNHRYLDLVIRMPKELSSFEDTVRKQIKEELFRGRIEVYVTIHETVHTARSVIIDENLAKAYLEAFQALRESLSLDEEKWTASSLASLPDVLQINKNEIEPERVSSVLESGLEEALIRLNLQRKREGERLEVDIARRIEIVKEMVHNMKDKSPQVLKDYQKRLDNRLRELHNCSDYDKQRFFTEVAFFAERSNIDEELVRLQSHLHTFKEDLSKDDGLGRKLDFLAQEINREINTIASKSNDLEISRMVVESKSEMEKIREQIQNIE